MKRPSVRIVVQPSGANFLASSYESLAIDVNSPHDAARKCAARHLNVEPSQLEVLETSPDTFVAYMRKIDAASEAAESRRSRRVQATLVALAMVAIVSLSLALIWLRR